MRVFLATVATALVALIVASPALSWTWPVEGPVARPFVFGDDPFAAGQHRASTSVPPWVRPFGPPARAR